MQAGLHALIGTRVVENGAPLAYAAVGTSGSERGDESEQKRTMRKSPPFNPKKGGKQVEGCKQRRWRAVADGSLWG